MSHPDTLGALVQDYVHTQCGVLLNSRAAIAARDESVVHPARVAIRRLRATLRTFGAVYESGSRTRFADELRWAGELLGGVRDLQVLAERFGADDGAVIAGAREVIADQIEHDRTEAWDDVVDAFSGARGAALFATIAHWRDEPPFTPKAERRADRARRGVAAADTEVNKRLAHARAASDAAASAAGEALHDARKAVKRHRYAVELAQRVLGAKAERIIERRLALQDALGAHQDAVVALAFLQRIDLGAQSHESAPVLRELITRTEASAQDVAGVLREVTQLHD